MIVGKIAGHTRILGKRQGYLGLPIRDAIVNEAVNGHVAAMSSAWFPTPSEIQDLVNGAAIYVTILGTVHPPIMLEVGKAEPLE